MSVALPNETIYAIFENLQPTVLVEVLCVSHKFHAVAERILYTNISLYEDIPLTAPVPYRTLCFCGTVLRRPHLTDIVRKLNIRWQTDSGTHEQYTPFVEPTLATLNRALRSFAALDSLELAFGLCGAPLAAERILGGCAFPALRALAFSGIGRGTLPPKSHAPTPPIDWFLAATPTLVHLSLFDCYEPLRLPADALPALASFRGSAIAAACVLPARPVHALALVGHDFVTAADLARIAQARAQIRWLDLGAMSVTPLLLRDVSRHLRGVAVLRVRLALRHTLHFALSGISMLAGLTPVLGAFPELHQLDLSPTAVDQIAQGNALEEAALCTTWARSCARLRHVVFPSKTEWTLSPEQIWVPHAPPRYTRA
ncbi:hypothetical protein B0H21DRAFT_814228 [Amylocystis lapponica]|nr:hypothetical protein B0H21DRAFT_814228 [Amylocystis lapponica]